ncbi:MAG: response regulator transcription factor [Kiritimatiellota bacterium]|nr:response regulator transcription factor [Kiritimatiellota bacterium]
MKRKKNQSNPSLPTFRRVGTGESGPESRDRRVGTRRHVKPAPDKITQAPARPSHPGRANRPGEPRQPARPEASPYLRRTVSRVAVKHSVFIVDDHPLVCEAIAGLINQQKDLTVCGTAGEYRAAMQAIDAARPKIVVVDISLGGKSGIDLIKDLCVLHPKMLAIVLSMHDEALYAARALASGARGYIMKSEPPEKIIDGIRLMLAGKIALSEPMRERLMTQLVGGKAATAIVSPLESLSDRELTVFELIGQGLGSSQIARKISLSIHTVQTYRERIKEKLNLRRAAELIQHAVQWIQNGKRS